MEDSFESEWTNRDQSIDGRHNTVPQSTQRDVPIRTLQVVSFTWKFQIDTTKRINRSFAGVVPEVANAVPPMALSFWNSPISSVTNSVIVYSQDERF